jgi:hypothetical protein
MRPAACSAFHGFIHWPDPLLQARHNLIGDALIKIGFHWLSPFQTGLRCCNPTRPAPMSGGAAVKAGGGVEGDHPVCTTLLRRSQRPKAAMNKNRRKTGDTPRAALKRGLALTAPGPQVPSSKKRGQRPQGRKAPLPFKKALLAARG